jgi:hypothetical protein
MRQQPTLNHDVRNKSYRTAIVLPDQQTVTAPARVVSAGQVRQMMKPNMIDNPLSRAKCRIAKQAIDHFSLS